MARAKSSDQQFPPVRVTIPHALHALALTHHYKHPHKEKGRPRIRRAMLLPSASTEQQTCPYRILCCAFDTRDLTVRKRNRRKVHQADIIVKNCVRRPLKFASSLLTRIRPMARCAGFRYRTSDYVAPMPEPPVDSTTTSYDRPPRYGSRNLAPSRVCPNFLFSRM